MSGIDNTQKRKKRRKTRSERNLSRGLANKPQQDQKHKSLKKEQPPTTASANPSFTYNKPQQDQKHKSSKKEQPTSFAHSNQNISYATRSGKGVNNFVPSNYRLATTGTITQNRITTVPRMFTNSKTSALIKRGPIPETEALKKRVESDMKRIMNLAEANRASDQMNPSVPGDDLEKSQEHSSDSGPEPSAMEVDASDQRSQTITTSNKMDTCSRDPHQSREKSGTPKDATVAVTVGGVRSAGKKKHLIPRPETSSCLSATPSPIKLDEYLEPEVPVEATAQKLLKELKVKMAAVFPNRDIQREICYDLHKLVKQSSCNIISKSVETTIPFRDPLLCTLSTLPKPRSGINSTLSAFRPSIECLSNTKTLEVADNNFNPPATGRNANVDHDRINDAEQVREEQDSDNIGFCPDSLVMKDEGSAEPIIRIITATSDSSSSCSSEDDEFGGLTAACCDAFFLDARDLAEQQQWQRQLYSQEKLMQDRKSAAGLVNRECNLIGTLPNKRHSSEHAHWRISNVPSLNEKSYGSHLLNMAKSGERHYSWMDTPSPCVTDKLPALSSSSSLNHQRSVIASNGINFYRYNPSCHRPNSANISKREWPPGSHNVCSTSSISRPRFVHQTPWEGHPVSSNSINNRLSVSRGGIPKSIHEEGYSCLDNAVHPSLVLNHPQLGHRARARQGDSFPTNGGKTTTCPTRVGSLLDPPESIGQDHGFAAYQHNFVSSVGQRDAKMRDIYIGHPSHEMGTCVIQSRQNFQTALDSACRDSGVDIGFRASGEPMDEDDDIFANVAEHKGPSLSHLPWQQYGGIQTHQVDMQRQARDFLEDLEKHTQPKSRSSKPFTQSLFGKSSSSTKDVPFMAASSSRSKDLPLKVASFIQARDFLEDLEKHTQPKSRSSKPFTQSLFGKSSSSTKDVPFMAASSSRS